jgi:iron complex outermembrane receptor protein
LGGWLTAAWLLASGAVAPESGGGAAAAGASVGDSVYTLPPISVTAPRIRPSDKLARLPGQTSYLDLRTARTDLTDLGELLDELPGLRVRSYGSIGHYSSASIRGSTAAQVRVYLDGVPLGRAGLGLTNLSELPFAGLDHVEIFRGFAPADLPATGPGGAINLVTQPFLPADEDGVAIASRVTAGAGDYETQRLGGAAQAAGHAWSALLVADHMESAGDFTFHDDNGTPANPGDDESVERQNNWLRRDEVLAKLLATAGGETRLTLLNQWIRRRQGVAGLPSTQATSATQGTTANLTSLEVQPGAAFSGRLQGRARLFHDWRRDSYADPLSEVGLGYQDNRDVSRSIGFHASGGLALPAAQDLSLLFETRQESFTPERMGQVGPDQDRTSLEATAEHRLAPWQGGLTIHATLRAIQETDTFRGDVRTPYSRRPAASGTREFIEPRAALRVRVLPGVHVEGSYGEYHRSPSFIELFGDGGSVAGSSDLVAEEGIQRDAGIELAQTLAGTRFRLEFARFHNNADHLILFLPQSQRTFVARNIGAARMWGSEWSWSLAPDGANRRWWIDGNYTHLRTQDTGIEVVYAGKVLPGRPEHELFAHAGVRAGMVEVGYRFEHLGQNFLDRFNYAAVARRELHGIDVNATLRDLSLKLAVRNLTDNQAQDVAGFPVPGRTVSLTSEYRF